MQDKHQQFSALLQQWNKAYNLTAIDEPAKIQTHHINDSLSIIPFLQGVTTVCDIGTGAGLPGIPLAIALPQIHFTLIDKVAKKITFIHQVIATLKLQNVTALHTRAEDLPNEHPFDVIVSRAVGDAKLLIKISQHVLKPGGRWLLMKGKNPQSELQHLQYPYSIHRLTVPDLPAERHLVEIINRG